MRSGDWPQATEQIIKPTVRASAQKYNAEKNLTRRSPDDCQT